MIHFNNDSSQFIVKCNYLSDSEGAHTAISCNKLSRLNVEYLKPIQPDLLWQGSGDYVHGCWEGLAAAVQPDPVHDTWHQYANNNQKSNIWYSLVYGPNDDNRHGDSKQNEQHRLIVVFINANAKMLFLIATKEWYFQREHRLLRPFSETTQMHELCPKPYAGVEEHCWVCVYKDRSRLWKCDEKWIMRFSFNLRMNDLP